jgi:hypothetical protein
MTSSGRPAIRSRAVVSCFGTMRNRRRRDLIYPKMGKVAASAGVYEAGGRKFLKLPILTAAQVIDGKTAPGPIRAYRKPEKRRAARGRAGKGGCYELSEPLIRKFCLRT